MKKIINTLTCIFVLLTLLFLCVYFYIPSKTTFTILVSFITTSYHFVMRIVVGYAVDGIYHNKMDYKKSWFQVSKKENEIYDVIKVKEWKKHMPTYSPETFSLKHHSFEEIAMSMCQSEVVHEIIVILSFLPVLAIPSLGKPLVFILTSFLAACFDFTFVIMQRYNRPRIIQLIEKRRSRN